jgi:hypothetical protein
VCIWLPLVNSLIVVCWTCLLPSSSFLFIHVSFINIILYVYCILFFSFGYPQGYHSIRPQRLCLSDGPHNQTTRMCLREAGLCSFQIYSGCFVFKVVLFRGLIILPLNTENGRQEWILCGFFSLPGWPNRLVVVNVDGPVFINEIRWCNISSPPLTIKKICINILRSTSSILKYVCRL